MYRWRSGYSYDFGVDVVMGSVKNTVKINSARIEEGIVRLDVIGSVDGSNCRIVSDEITKLFSESIYKIVVNLKETVYISSPGFGLFVSLLDEAVRNKGDMIFVQPSADLQEIFEMLGLTKLLKFAPTVEDGLASLKSI